MRWHQWRAEVVHDNALGFAHLFGQGEEESVGEAVAVEDRRGEVFHGYPGDARNVKTLATGVSEAHGCPLMDHGMVQQFRQTGDVRGEEIGWDAELGADVHGAAAEEVEDEGVS